MVTKTRWKHRKKEGWNLGKRVLWKLCADAYSVTRSTQLLAYDNVKQTSYSGAGNTALIHMPVSLEPTLFFPTMLEPTLGMLRSKLSELHLCKPYTRSCMNPARRWPNRAGAPAGASCVWLAACLLLPGSTYISSWLVFILIVGCGGACPHVNSWEQTVRSPVLMVKV
jgi:hypothetical protein